MPFENALSSARLTSAHPRLRQRRQNPKRHTCVAPPPPRTIARSGVLVVSCPESPECRVRVGPPSRPPRQIAVAGWGATLGGPTHLSWRPSPAFWSRSRRNATCLNMTHGRLQGLQQADNTGPMKRPNCAATVSFSGSSFPYTFDCSSCVLVRVSWGNAASWHAVGFHVSSASRN